MNRIKKIEIILFPPTFFVLHYLLFHFLPPAVTGSGYHLFQTILNLSSIAIFVLCFLAMLALFGFRKKPIIKYSFSFFICFYIILLMFRLYELYELGVIAFVIGSKAQLGLFTFIRIVLWPCMLILLFYEVRKRKWLYLLLLIEIAYTLITLSKTSLVLLVLAYLCVFIKFDINKISVTKLLKIFIAGVATLYLVFFIGSHMLSLRAPAYNNSLTSDNINLGSNSDNKPSVINQTFDRLNLHPYGQILYDNSNEVDRLQSLVIDSMFKKFAGLEKEYKIHPNGTSATLSRNLGLVNDFYTSLEYPTNMSVYVSFGFAGVVCFYFIWSLLFYFLYYFSRSDPVIFLAIYFGLIFQLLNQGALLPAFLFNNIFYALMVCLFIIFPLIIFNVTKRFRL